METDPRIHALIRLASLKKITICGAESCTGGLISKLITDIPGASSVFTGCIVAYSNDVKISVLGVNAETILEHGAVSEETASEMASGAKKNLQAGIAYAVTGIAGPGGGTPDKPAGTVCFAFSSGGTTLCRKKNFPGDRDAVRSEASMFVINELIRIIGGIAF